MKWAEREEVGGAVGVPGHEVYDAPPPEAVAPPLDVLPLHPHDRNVHLQEQPLRARQGVALVALHVNLNSKRKQKQTKLKKKQQQNKARSLKTM